MAPKKGVFRACIRCRWWRLRIEELPEDRIVREYSPRIACCYIEEPHPNPHVAVCLGVCSCCRPELSLVKPTHSRFCVHETSEQKTEQVFSVAEKGSFRESKFGPPRSLLCFLAYGALFSIRNSPSFFSSLQMNHDGLPRHAQDRRKERPQKTGKGGSFSHQMNCVETSIPSCRSVSKRSNCAPLWSGACLGKPRANFPLLYPIILRLEL